MDGWKLVPIEPTPEMLRAPDSYERVMRFDEGDVPDNAYIWREMAAAAPQRPLPVYTAEELRAAVLAERAACIAAVLSPDAAECYSREEWSVAEAAAERIKARK